MWYFLLISAANLANAVFYWQVWELVPLSKHSLMPSDFSLSKSCPPSSSRYRLCSPISWYALFCALFRFREANYLLVQVCRMILGLRERGVRHTSGNNHGASAASSGRKFSNANKLTAVAVGTAKVPTNNHGAITDMGFNHELTTFQRDVPNDSESMVGRDIKSVPYEEGVVDPKARSGIRVDIESHRYYENSDGDDDHKGQSFMA